MHRNLLLVFVLSFSALAAIPQLASAQSDYQGFVCSDEEGCWRGVPGAVVTFTKAGTISALDESHKATTNKEGRFSMSGLDGDYSVSVVRKGFAEFTGTASSDAGEQTFQLKPKTVNLTGTISSDGAKLAGASVSTWSPQGSHSAKTTDGTYAMKLPAGYRHFEVRASGYQTLYQERFVDGTGQSFSLVKTPGLDSTISGVVRDQDGTPVADATINVYQYGYETYDRPKPASEPSSGSAASYAPYDYSEQQATTDAQGRYSVKAREGDANMNVFKDGYASANAHFFVEGKSTQTKDFTLQKFPDKTAHIKGQITDAKSGDGLRWATISINYPAYGLYVCSQTTEDAQANSADGQPEPAMDSISRPYYQQGCDITVHSDGSFSGDVYPGYATINVWYDHWRTCSESSSSDGSFTRTCGQQYLGFVQTTTLPADATTTVNMKMQPRAGPDAKVDGWILDAATGKPIPGAHVSFNNQDSYGWGEATTDKDGSFAVRIHSGYLHVYVWADGYLPWQGTVTVAEGGSQRIKIELTEGQQSYGGCCYAYAEDRAMEASSGGSPSMGAAAATQAPPAGADQSQSGASADAFEDLGGGLGPYSEAKEQASDAESPGLGLLATIALLGAVVYARRK